MTLLLLRMQLTYLLKKMVSLTVFNSLSTVHLCHSILYYIYSVHIADMVQYSRCIAISLVFQSFRISKRSWS